MTAWVAGVCVGLLVLTIAMAMKGSCATTEHFGVREQNEYTHRCPDSHPYPFNSQGVLGGFCCRTDNITKAMAPQDYTQTCADSNYVRCPGGWNCGPGHHTKE